MNGILKVLAVISLAAVMGGCGQTSTMKKGCFEPKDLDANHDGKVSKAEAVSFYTEEFKWFDQDNDGSIKLDDFVSAPDVKAMIDADKNGVATEKEYVDYYSSHPCKCGKYM